MWHATTTVVAALGLKIKPIQLFTQVMAARHMKIIIEAERHMPLQCCSVMWPRHYNIILKLTPHFLITPHPK
jgi:hypothetical protein